MINTKELRRLAQAATPGPWKVDQYLGSPRQFVIHMDVGDKGRGSDVAFTSANFGNDKTIANARLIAAANPTTILELLDRLEAAESTRRDDYQNWMTALDRNAELLAKLEAAEKTNREWLRANAPGGWIDNLRIENDALRAKIERMEKQEPVAKVRVHRTGGNAGLAWSVAPLNDFDSLPLMRDGDRLYALPGAKGEEK